MLVERLAALCRQKKTVKSKMTYCLPKEASNSGTPRQLLVEGRIPNSKLQVLGGPHTWSFKPKSINSGPYHKPSSELIKRQLHRATLELSVGRKWQAGRTLGVPALINVTIQVTLWWTCSCASVGNHKGHPDIPLSSNAVFHIWVRPLCERGVPYLLIACSTCQWDK